MIMTHENTYVETTEDGSERRTSVPVCTEEILVPADGLRALGQNLEQSIRENMHALRASFSKEVAVLRVKISAFSSLKDEIGVMRVELEA